jgi:hypothetical protein
VRTGSGWVSVHVDRGRGVFDTKGLDVGVRELVRVGDGHEVVLGGRRQFDAITQEASVTQVALQVIRDRFGPARMPMKGERFDGRGACNSSARPGFVHSKRVTVRKPYSIICLARFSTASDILSLVTDRTTTLFAPWKTPVREISLRTVWQSRTGSQNEVGRSARNRQERRLQTSLCPRFLEHVGQNPAEGQTCSVASHLVEPVKKADRVSMQWPVRHHLRYPSEQSLTKRRVDAIAYDLTGHHRCL